VPAGPPYGVCQRVGGRQRPLLSSSADHGAPGSATIDSAECRLDPEAVCWSSLKGAARDAGEAAVVMQVRPWQSSSLSPRWLVLLRGLLPLCWEVAATQDLVQGLMVCLLPHGAAAAHSRFCAGSSFHAGASGVGDRRAMRCGAVPSTLYFRHNSSS